jgi:hypothetical protein
VVEALPRMALLPSKPKQPHRPMRPALPPNGLLDAQPNGQPDLQGVWTNATRVPLQRPKELGSREFYTPEEAAENARRGVVGDRPTSYPTVEYDLAQFGLPTGQEAVAPSLRTSLIIGPTGRIPPLTKEAEKRVAARAAFLAQHRFDGPETRSLQERCIWDAGSGPPMLPNGYELQFADRARSRIRRNSE